ncbi:MAG: universal stress protein [Pseudomonadales bacterium]|jgi:nucleotide-binding universal stress UspA family protein|nr:universal stress protein [Pseudomonadales bacterium]
MYRKLLVPTDFSPQARTALDLALELLPAEGASLCLLAVPDREPSGSELRRWSGSPGSGSESVERETRSQLEALASEIARDGLEVDTVFSWVQPALAIVETAEARDVDAIVMGSRGRSDVAGLMLGSVSHRVLHTAQRRVIVVR